MTIAADKEQWNAIRPLGKGRFVLRVFCQTLGVTFVALLLSELLSETPHWTGRRIAIKLLIAVACSAACALIWGVGTWQDLERQFGLKDGNLR